MQKKSRMIVVMMLVLMFCTIGLTMGGCAVGGGKYYYKPLLSDNLDENNYISVTFNSLTHKNGDKTVKYKILEEEDKIYITNTDGDKVGTLTYNKEDKTITAAAISGSGVLVGVFKKK